DERQPGRRRQDRRRPQRAGSRALQADPATRRVAPAVGLSGRDGPESRNVGCARLHPSLSRKFGRGTWESRVRSRRLELPHPCGYQNLKTAGGVGDGCGIVRVAWKLRAAENSSVVWFGSERGKLWRELAERHPRLAER